MSNKLYNIITLFTVSIISIIIILSIHNLTKEKIELLKHKTYDIYSSSIKDEVKLLIDNKKDATLSIALALSNDVNIQKSLKENNHKTLALDKFSLYLREQTKFKNVWFQIINNQGTTLYRSWSSKKGDEIYKVRLDVQEMLKKPKIMSTISTGKFDMTFKSMVPIYNNGTFIGIIEIITHFNSTAKQLEKNNLKSVFLVDKSYKKQLKKPFTKLFIGDYYVANLNADQKLMDLIQDYGVEYYSLNKNNYIIDKHNNYFIVTYFIPNIIGKDMGTIIIFKNLNDIQIKDIELLKNNTFVYSLLIVVFLFIIAYYLINARKVNVLYNNVLEKTKDLNKEKRYIQRILDTSTSMIMVSNNSRILNANSSFLRFFNYISLEEFTKKHSCVCEYFTSFNGIKFPKDKLIENEYWSKYLLNNQSSDNLITLELDKEEYSFLVSAVSLDSDNHFILTFNNITELKNKDKLISRQARLASMGEMIANIAHQWRQPLSIISTCATSLQLQQEYGKLNENTLSDTCEKIHQNSKYLSNTIDDLKDFINDDRITSSFSINDFINTFINSSQNSIQKYKINVVLNLADDYLITSYEKDLQQIFISIYNNCIDAFHLAKTDKNLLFIETQIDEEKIYISFKDNANGIDESILDNIFEPYITTKHKRQGTGLGLYMTNNIIANDMKGNIEVKNVNYTYSNNDYKGALVSVTLPLRLSKVQ